MHLIFFDDQFKDEFLPFTYTRPISDLRIGICTLAEKWAFDLNSSFTHVHQLELSSDSSAVYVNSRWLANPSSREALESLQSGEALVHGTTFLAFRQNQALNKIDFQDLNSLGLTTKELPSAELITQVTDIFTRNGDQIQKDFSRLTSGKASQKLDPSNQLIGPQNQLFIEPGAKIQGAILNTSEGPIYIGPDAEVMEGSLVRGPFSLGEHAVLKMGAKIYGGTTIGPWSKVGGEVSNSVILGFSNKGHDGFLGNSIIGMWCNLGADTNTSNLKNNYGDVRIWNYAAKEMRSTGLTFCGLIMGDHSKCSINTMFNTGTTVGVSANIFGGNFPPKFIPSFSWGGAENMTTYDLQKAMQTAERVYARRGLAFGEEDGKLFQDVFAKTSGFRD